MIATINQHHFVDIFQFKNKTVMFKSLTNDEMRDIQVNGVRIFQFCGSLRVEIESMLETARLFLGGMGPVKFIEG